MRTFFILAASSLLLAAVVTELSTRLWPDARLPLLILAALALLVQGYLSRRLVTAQPAARDAAPERKAEDRTSTAPPRRREKAADEPPAQGPRESGTVKWFNRTKGFRFIVRESGEEIFVHQRSIRSEGSGDNRRRPALRDGQAVTFVVANREKGLQAEDVTPA